MATPLVQPYLFFSGRCEEALNFYQDAVGAQIEMMLRFDQSPEPPQRPLEPGYETKIMHASFKIGDCTIMASDGCGDPVRFEGFSLSIAVENEDVATQFFSRLSEGGEVTLPLGKTFWSSCFGMVTDRFGIGWMVTVPA